MTVSRTTIAALALVLTAAVVAGQQAPPAGQPASQQPPDPQMPPITFRAEVNFVEVDTVVRDAQGNFVRDLKPGEFQVLEDGVPQAVTAFSLIEIPVTRAERAMFLPRELEPDVQSNARTPDGRLYVLMLDDIHTGAQRSLRVRQAGKQFIERNLGANDLMAVVFSSGRTDGAQDFTNNRRLLAQAVDKFMGRKLPSAYLNKLDAYNLARASGQVTTVRDADDAERLHNARSLLSMVTNLSDWLSGIHGRRKAVVLISEGLDYNIWDTMGALQGETAIVASGRASGVELVSEVQDAIAAATRANVNFYAVDPRGLYAMGDEIMQASPPVEADAIGLGLSTLHDELRISQDSLRTLAEETGGFASLSSNDFSTAFQRIVDENSSYYVLGYHSTNEKRDGRFRRIEVRLTRPGLTVRARKGYAAPRGKLPADKNKNVEVSAGTSKELRDALNSPLQASDLKFAVFAAPLKGKVPKAAVAIVTQVQARDMAFTQKDGKFHNALEISYIAVDKQGKVAAGTRDSIDLQLKPETYQRVMQAGFRVQTRLELPPGSYQLRVAAREGGGKTGSVHYDLTVPDFGKEPLGLSGLILSSYAAGGIPTAGTIPDIGAALPTPPTTARVFSAQDELAVLAEIYDNRGDQSHSVDIKATLKAEGSVSVFSNSEQRSSRELGGAKGGYGYTTRIPLKDLAAGLYVMRIEAKSSLGGTETVAREVQIRIVR